MKCDLCHINEANITIKGDVPGIGFKELHICPTCAAKQGFDALENIVKGVGLSKLFESLASNSGEKIALDFAEDEAEVYDDGLQTVCESCGHTLDDLKKSGKFGCENCYDAFSEIIMQVLANMHKGVIHIPRDNQRGAINVEVASVVELTLEISRKQKDLQTAIKNEHFEKAAELRDEITDLQKKLDDCISNNEGEK